MTSTSKITSEILSQMSTSTEKKRPFPDDFSEITSKKQTGDYDVDGAKISLDSEWANFIQENNPVIQSDAQLNIHERLSDSEKKDIIGNTEEDLGEETKEEEQKLLEDLDIQKELYNRVKKLRNRVSDKSSESNKLLQSNVVKPLTKNLIGEETSDSEINSDADSESDDVWRKKV